MDHLWLKRKTDILKKFKLQITEYNLIDQKNSFFPTNRNSQNYRKGQESVLG